MEINTTTKQSRLKMLLDPTLDLQIQSLPPPSKNISPKSSCLHHSYPPTIRGRQQLWCSALLCKELEGGRLSIPNTARFYLSSLSFLSPAALLSLHNGDDVSSFRWWQSIPTILRCCHKSQAIPKQCGRGSFQRTRASYDRILLIYHPNCIIPHIMR